MRQRPIHQASPAVILSWRKRQARLSEAIAAQPSHTSAWLWAIRLKIIGFLLTRYDTFPPAGAVASGIAPTAPDLDLDTDAAAPAAGSAAKPADVEQRASPIVPTRTSHPPRGRTAIQARLDHLRDENATRYAQVSKDNEQIAEMKRHDQIVFAEYARQMKTAKSPEFATASSTEPDEIDDLTGDEYLQDLDGWFGEGPPLTEEELLAILMNESDPDSADRPDDPQNPPG